MADDLDFDATIRGLLPGQMVFGRYTLKRILGRGGMGLVWLARDKKLERDIALKFLPEAVALDARAVDDLKRETRRALDLTYPHIVRIYDFLDDSRSAAIAMEWVDGPTLSALALERPDRIFTVEELRPWVKQLCEALSYAHDKAQVVHRDLKPANLMIDARGDLKIADLGISATLSDSTTRVSKAAGTSGTPLYMSPQQMMGEKPAVTDDVYALGATLYELLAGKPPFYSGRIELQVLNKVAPSMAERRKELEVRGEPIPAAWEVTVAACLDKDPVKRPQTVAAVWLRLQAVTVPAVAAPVAAVPPAPPVSTPPRRSSSALKYETSFAKPKKGAESENGADLGSIIRYAGASNANPKASLAWTVSLLLMLVGVGGGGFYWWTEIEGPRQAAAVAEAQGLANARGGMIITTEPAGAEVWSQGKRLGTTPLTFSDLVPGSVDLEFRLKGYRTATRSGGIVANQTTQVAVTLEEQNGPRAGQPYENSLGMKFVPVAGTGVLFSIWETREQDYGAFAKRSSRAWRNANAGATHPAVNVSWEDAQAFCAWLTQEEREAGRLNANQSYRLPTDAEWSVAVGLSNEPGTHPSEKNMKVKGQYPWGTRWPPPNGAGNYESSLKVDRFKGTSPVGSFEANRYGIYDLGGNVWEWVEDKWDRGSSWRVLRGASFNNYAPDNLLSSYRDNFTPVNRSDNYGFRVVVAVGSPVR